VLAVVVVSAVVERSMKTIGSSHFTYELCCTMDALRECIASGCSPNGVWKIERKFMNDIPLLSIDVANPINQMESEESRGETIV